MCAVNEVYINFASGKISGECSGCNAAEVADALVAIATALRMMDDTPDYVDYDEGKISVG
jgi:hypothetical protein